MEKTAFAPDAVAQRVYDCVLEKAAPQLKPVINATGVILHTNLGRAFLSAGAEKALLSVSANYSNLEVDAATNKRSDRIDHLEPLLCLLINAPAATVVNNNAAAVFLALNTFAFRKEVIVSRGQLVEIGGAFRLPEIMKASGAKLVEVGTTNITYLSDYEKAITDKTAMLLHVHPSNFAITGFTQEVGLEQLVRLARSRGLLTMSDMGSGVLIDLKKYGFGDEPPVQSAIKSGADVVSFSGDKLLGGPQAGILAGGKACLERMKKNPLNRALRVDKLRIAALEATLKSYLDEQTAIRDIPVLEMLLRPLPQIAREAADLFEKLSGVVAGNGRIQIADGFSQLGGGALPAENIPTKVIRFLPARLSPDVFAARLRRNNPPVFTRIAQGELILDPRTLHPKEYKVIAEAFNTILKK
jgi:L-seryl-tRNA(Sec) selenium transferase (EC 2.9.1.1)